MRFYRPRSFLLLVLLGFLFVSLPLIVALVNAERSMGRLANQSAEVVYRSVGATQLSRILVDSILDLERRVRQYDVLGDEHLLGEAIEKHREISGNLSQLLGLPLEAEQLERLADLQREEAEIFEVLRTNPRGGEAWQQALERFGQLHKGAQRAHSENNQLIVKEVDAMQKATAKAQQDLIWQSLALIPFSVMFVGLFTHLIHRPINQIDKVIHRLGEGDFETPAKVGGAKDLEFLGQRLDWLRRQLAELERAKSKFVAEVSHELKTPLASIREGAELLSDQVVGPLNHQQREISGILCKSSIQLQKLIENLLGFSKAQAKVLPLHGSEVPLEQLVEEVIADYKLMVLKKNLVLDTMLEPTTLWGDRERLKTMVDNLVSNAIKYTPLGGTVRVWVREDQGLAVLDVSDTGPGIPEDEHDKVFEPFYQGQFAPSPGHIKGTGLGLSIVREFVQAHSGQIGLVADPEAGAHFRVTLPLQEPEQEKDVS